MSAGRINYSQPRGPSEYQREQHKAMAKRDREIRRLRARGWKLAAIAERHGVTKQRVHQIVSAK